MNKPTNIDLARYFNVSFKKIDLWEQDKIKIYKALVYCFNRKDITIKKKVSKTDLADFYGVRRQNIYRWEDKMPKIYKATLFYFINYFEE